MAGRALASGGLRPEEAFKGMTKGYVSEEWMKQHHDLWYDQVKRGEADQGARGRDASASPGHASERA